MSIYSQSRFRFPGRPRHALGLYIPYVKLSSRGYVPTRRDRQKLIGKRPFDIVFGGSQDDVTLPASQSIQLRYTVQSDFIATTITTSATVSSAASPGCRVRVLVLSTMPGKGKKLSTEGGVNNVNFGGNGQHQKFFKRLYRIHAGKTIIVQITNLRAVSNKIQVVISGVWDE